MKKSSLVLGRRRGERVLIGNPPNQISIQVMSVEADRVDLHFVASNTVPIDRWEVAVKKGREIQYPEI